MVLRSDDWISQTAGEGGARLMVQGGETINGPRYVSLNLVASSQEKNDSAPEA